MAAMKKIVLVSFLVACGGGGSGVDSGKKLHDLSVAELNEECNYSFDTYPKKTVTCPDGSTVSTGQDPAKRATSCNATVNDVPATCTVTVGQAEQCIEDIYNEPAATVCNPNATFPPSCAPLFNASCQSTARTAPMSRGEVIDLALHFAR